jgi:hypothetical protein
MYYLQVIAPSASTRRAMPRDMVQGPFTSAIEAKGYWTKLTMWFPEALQGANYRITGRTIPSDAAADRSTGR